MMILIKKYWLVVLRYAGLILGLALFLKQLTSSIFKYSQVTNLLDRWPQVVIALLVIVIIYFIQVLLWLCAMNSIGCRISLYFAVKTYWISFLPRYIPGGVWGYLGRNEWLKKELNIPYESSNLGSILEILLNTIGAGILLLLTINSWIHIMLRLFAAVVIVLLIWVIISKTLRILAQSKKFKLLKFINIPKNGVNVKYLVYGLWFSISIWILFGLALFLITSSVSITTKTYSPIQTIASMIEIYAISWLIGFYFIFIPSGLGLRELVLSSLLTLEIPTTDELSVSLAVLMRLLTLFAESIWMLGAVLLFIKGSRSKDNPNVLLNK